MSSGVRDSDRTGSGDDIDKANALAQMFNDQALSEAMERSRPQQVVAADGSYPHPDCVECGEPLPLLRLQMGRVRCVECQEYSERGRLFT